MNGGASAQVYEGVVGVDVRRSAIAELQRPRGYPAVSLLMPTHRHHPESAQDPIRLRNLLGRARRLLSAAGAQGSSVSARLAQAARAVDFTRTLDGLAILATADEQHVLHLPIPVRGRVVVDTSFATRDLVRALQRTPRCWVLVLSERTTRLFEGLGEHLVEITRDGFPLHNEEEAEPLPADFGQEPSAHRLARRRRFFRRANEEFASFAAEQPLPVVHVGVERVLAAFEKVTRHRHLVIGRVPGGLEAGPAHQIAEHIRPVVADHVGRNRAAALGALETAVSQRRYSAGLGEVTQLAQQGRVAHLLVEEHFGLPEPAGDQDGEPGGDGSEPYGEDSEPYGDAVDELVEAVLARDGQVTFVEDGALADRGRVAVILRY